MEVKKSSALIILKPEKAYTVNEVDLLFWKHHQEDNDIYSYNRFIDLTNLCQESFNSYNLMKFSDLIKRLRSDNNNQRSCFLCGNQGISDIASVFLEIGKPDYANNRITTKIDECAAFLELDPGMLELNAKH